MTLMEEPFPLGVLEADSPLREEPFHFVGVEADSPWQVEPSLCAEWEGDNLAMVATSNCSDLVASNSWPAAHRRWTWKDEEGASIPWTEERKLRTSLNVELSLGGDTPLTEACMRLPCGAESLEVEGGKT